MLMLDVCSGLGGASAAMRDRGWEVISIDIEPRFSPDIVADVRSWSWHGARPDLIWCSPPCTEFSRESMPWSRTGRRPDMSIVNACNRIVQESAPRYWILENVRGAKRYLGRPTAIVGPFYLWGHFPSLGYVRLNYKKESYPGQRPDLRAMIPYSLSLAVALAIEQQPALVAPGPFNTWTYYGRTGEGGQKWHCI